MKLKIITLFLILVLCLSLAVTVSAKTYQLFDDADLLTDTEEAQLTQKLDDVSQQCSAQIVIATVPSMADGNVEVFLNHFYDSMNFGYGENRDGVLLVVCMNPREVRILSNGYAGTAISNYEIESILDAIVPSLSAGDYHYALNTYVDECAYYLDGYRNGFPFNFGKTLIICLIIGFAVGLIVVFILKGQLKSVRRQNQANVYVKHGSMQITMQNDLFLYRNVTRTKKESSSSSSSSRSGSSRSSGGRSF